jgi:hypothetical protein
MVEMRDVTKVKRCFVVAGVCRDAHNVRDLGKSSCLES